MNKNFILKAIGTCLTKYGNLDKLEEFLSKEATRYKSNVIRPSGKINVSFHLPPSINNQLDKIFIQRNNNIKRYTRSALIEEAIKLLYAKEFGE